MKIKVRVDEAGNAYVGVIDPRSGDHKKSVAVNKCQEVVLSLPSVHDENGVEIDEVIDCDTGEIAEKAPESPQEPAPAEGGGEGDQSASAPAEGEGELPAGLGIGRLVTFRHPDGLDLPAVVNVTRETINQFPTNAIEGLSSPSAVHLTVFCPSGGGGYPGFNIPQEILGDGDSEPSPGCWRWPERK